jgi:hypothetical protein
MNSEEGGLQFVGITVCGDYCSVVGKDINLVSTVSDICGVESKYSRLELIVQAYKEFVTLY